MNSDVIYLDQYGADMTATAAEGFFDYSYTSGFGRDNMAYGVLVDFANTNDFKATDTICKSGAYSVTLNADAVTAVKNNTVKFSIAQIKVADKAKTAADWDVAGKVKTVAIDVVPVDKLTGIAFASVGKQKLETGKANSANGAEAGLATVITVAISDADVSFNEDDGFDVKITGNYQGKALTIPTAYYTLDTANVTTGTAADAVNTTNIAAVSGPTMKWSELYDSNSARLTRKDATVTIKADVFNTIAKASQDKNATVKLSVKVSDEVRKASKIVIKDGTAATKQVNNTTSAAASWFTLDSDTASKSNYSFTPTSVKTYYIRIRGYHTAAGENIIHNGVKQILFVSKNNKGEMNCETEK